jgi:hypothetical protein
MIERVSVVQPRWSAGRSSRGRKRLNLLLTSDFGRQIPSLMIAISPSGGMRSSRMLHPTHPARRALWLSGGLRSTTHDVRKLEWMAISDCICHDSLRPNRQSVGAVLALMRAMSAA